MMIKTMIFPHWPHVSFSSLHSAKWHHNRLLMMSQMHYAMQQLWCSHMKCNIWLIEISILLSAIFMGGHVRKKDIFRYDWLRKWKGIISLMREHHHESVVWMCYYCESCIDISLKGLGCYKARHSNKWNSDFASDTTFLTRMFTKTFHLYWSLSEVRIISPIKSSGLPD